MPRAIAVALAIAADVTLSACNAPYLTWTPREPLAARRGRVAISVEDRRSTHELGTAYGLGGVPVAVRARDDEPRVRLLRLATDALYTAGLAPEEHDHAHAPTSRLALGLEQLRCDGSHLRAHATLALTYAVVAPDGEGPSHGSVRFGPNRVTFTGKGRGCGAAFHDVLDQLLDELGAVLVEGPAHEAALHPANPA